MLLIKELLELHDNALNEDLGTLKIIDKKFRKALMLGSQSRTDKAKIKAAKAAGTEVESWNRTVARNIIKGGLGENSKTEEHTVKNDKELMELINNPKYGAVLMHDGVHQYAIFTSGRWPMEHQNWKIAVSRAMSIDWAVINDIDPAFEAIVQPDRSSGQTGAPGMKPKPGRLYKMGVGLANDVFYYDSSDTDKVSAKFVIYIMALFKGIKKTAQVTCFTVDEAGKARAAARQEARKEAVPDLRNDSVRRAYEKDIKSAFKGRLDKYKSDKSVRVGTPEEALKAIVDKGYLDKITINGITYDYHDDRINFRVMRKPSTGHSSDSSYITYKINRDTPEYKQLDAKRNELRQQFKDENTAAGMEKPYDYTDDQEKQLAPFRPAAEFKLMLKLEGAKIIPHEIVFEQGFLW